MKKLIFLFIFLFAISVKAQKHQVDVVKYNEVTTAERDAFVVPAGEFWRIYNSTTSQHEFWDGDSWEPLGSAIGGLPHTEILQTAYDALTNPELNDVVYFIKQKAAHTVGKLIYRGIFYGETCWIGTEAEKTAEETSDPTYFEDICWRCTDCSPVGGGGGSVTVEDNLTSVSTTNALSANQGRILELRDDNVATQFYKVVTTASSFNTTTFTGITTFGTSDIIIFNNYGGDANEDYLLIDTTAGNPFLSTLGDEPGNVYKMSFVFGVGNQDLGYESGTLTFSTTEITGLPDKDPNYVCFKLTDYNTSSISGLSENTHSFYFNLIRTETSNYVQQTSGTFTGQLVPSTSGSYTIGSNQCTYLISDNMVTINVYMTSISNNSATGTMSFTGIPQVVLDKINTTGKATVHLNGYSFQYVTAIITLSGGANFGDPIPIVYRLSDTSFTQGNLNCGNLTEFAFNITIPIN